MKTIFKIAVFIVFLSYCMDKMGWGYKPTPDTYNLGVQEKKSRSKPDTIWFKPVKGHFKNNEEIFDPNSSEYDPCIEDTAGITDMYRDY